MFVEEVFMEVHSIEVSLTQITGNNKKMMAISAMLMLTMKQSKG